jgi:hypothetical protein
MVVFLGEKSNENKFSHSYGRRKWQPVDRPGNIKRQSGEFSRLSRWCSNCANLLVYRDLAGSAIFLSPSFVLAGPELGQRQDRHLLIAISLAKCNAAEPLAAAFG